MDSTDNSSNSSTETDDIHELPSSSFIDFSSRF